ncbi:Thymidylate synthase [Achromobacter anxifer]|uniref:thymidylate synthase n=1 Tax=Achromobacter anxifer TaxID=1287737 RepID=UPI00155B889D|nr:thymidylate synthase [Achromobacter anxifer]CAB5514242.1 Thymidylate synthase [Achromobacter anxifer]
MTKPHPMEQFHELLRHIRDHGVRQFNSRTGEYVRFVPGHMLKFDMADGFPAITSKQLYFRPAKGELFGFFRGYQSAKQFRDELNCKVWDTNANVTPAWLNSQARRGPDDAGRIYGAQWTDWRDWREAESEGERDDLLAHGYEIRAHDPDRGRWIMRRGINQLEAALRTIMTNPSDRGIIVTGWRPDEFDQMCLRPCHVDYQFIVDTTSNVLHLSFYQRSWDTALAFNTVLGALFLHIMARLAGLTAGTVSHHVGDAHIYEKHLEGVELMLSREHYPQPTLDLGNIPTLTSVSEISGIFARLDPEQVQLVGYEHHPAIKFEMTA